MRFVVPLLIGLCGCGRIDFDPRGDASGGGTLDAPCTFGPWGTPRLQVTTVSPVNEFSPALSGDGLAMYFESPRAGGAGGYDVYFATRPTILDDFGPVTSAGPVNTAGDDRGPALTSDGLTMYVLITGPRLYRATRASTSDLFGPATIVPELSTVDVEGPSISTDGTELFLSQGINLYRATFDGSTFQTPTPITELNTSAAQGFPSISGDGLDLYFEEVGSDGPFDDVWVAHRDTIGGAFTNAMRVDVSIAGANDADPEISRDGRTLVWASDRPGSMGHDLYLATRSCL